MQNGAAGLFLRHRAKSEAPVKPHGSVAQGFKIGEVSARAAAKI